MVEQGKKAPDFTLPSVNGELVSLSHFIGKNVVLYFYPKDMTPGCTTQACDFRDQYDVFEANNTVIIGVSPDAPERHAKFIAKYDLSFILLSDEEQQVARLYDVWKLKKNFGKEYMGIERSTFLINARGELVHEWRRVKVKGHVDDVMEAVKKLQ
ncbi:thioredoxin-dependent thiol peroxidase [Ectobacillus sp. JY-23]|uniref:thioredoxin-dependent thiol peroxidase n=1 Tax=Ectobacillus sp. JY-23 TaxID=2933872 RepID=UPI001FF21ECD|nr:thioredoxin-dependent thiol peroxidase [Ectobacillus sp. JY-23]UOY91825.1 thioredoxin-dependent thiol peroxidase [Ectobacillus sp. JY-23]